MQDIRLSKNFLLSEFLRSDIAERQGGQILRDQLNPHPQIILNLQRLAAKALQPIRDNTGELFMDIKSGYRCPFVNKAVGSTDRSQHLYGMAGDTVLRIPVGVNFIDTEFYRRVKKDIESIVDKEVKSKNPTFFLFAYICMNLNRFDIDQVIHEYGIPGHPAWCHIGSSEWSDGRQIKLITFEDDKKINMVLSLNEALMLGC